MRILKVLAALFVLLLALVVIFQNTGRVAISVLWWRVEAPALVMFAAMFLSGAVLGLAAPTLLRLLTAGKPPRE